jgi:hypothetical protein
MITISVDTTAIEVLQSGSRRSICKRQRDQLRREATSQWVCPA